MRLPWAAESAPAPTKPPKRNLFLPGTVQPPAGAERVNFAIRCEVRTLIDEWKFLELQKCTGENVEGFKRAMGRRVLSIKAKLFAEGTHDVAALRNVMLAAAAELGYSPEQSAILIDNILATADTSLRARKRSKQQDEIFPR